MAGLRQCMRLGQASVRRLSTNAPLKSQNPLETPLYKRLKANQELFQREDTVEEVYIKGGMKDVVLFKAIVGLTFVGLICDAKIMYTFAFET